ncbi:neurobeachin-like protein 1 isoform X2 [Glandiceps talaboti]
MASDEQLYQLWLLYSTKHDVQYWKLYVKQFIQSHDNVIDLSHKYLTEGFESDGPHISKLPEGILEVINTHLVDCRELCQENVNLDSLSFATQLIKVLIIICRNLDNIPLVTSCDHASHLVAIATNVVKQITIETSDSNPLVIFVQHCLHLLECMYDPYHVWRKRLQSIVVDKSQFKFKPGFLAPEIQPFLYESLQDEEGWSLSSDLQIHLLHMFGAVLSGMQINALKATNPFTVDTLFKLVTSKSIVQHLPAKTDVVELVLKCVNRMIHVIHCCSPEKRQIDVSTVLGIFLNILIDKKQTHHSVELQQCMLRSIPGMLQCRDKAALQAILLAVNTFRYIMQILDIAKNAGEYDRQVFGVLVMKVLSALMTGSVAAKETFKDNYGYDKLSERLQALGQPSRELIDAVLDVIIEGTFSKKCKPSMPNTKVALVLLKWIPDIEDHELQVWVAEALKFICTFSTHNRMHSCNTGMITIILEVLRKSNKMHSKTVGHLCGLLEFLGMHSITACEFKNLIGLLRGKEDSSLSPLCGRLMHCMSVMARREDQDGPLHYFDFQHNTAGISIPGIPKWPGSGFSFHTWINLDSNPITPSSFETGLYRRQLYSFFTDSGMGFEAFFTMECILIIAVCTKKEYFTVSVLDHPFTDNQWHALDIVHSSGKRPFGQSQINVFIDGGMVLTTQLRFPVMNEAFTLCRVGSGGHRTNVPKNPSELPLSPTVVQPTTPFPFNLPSPLTPRGSGSFQETLVTSTNAGSQDYDWGVPCSLQGQMGSVCVFHEALSPVQIKYLSHQGPNHTLLFQSESGDVSEQSLAQRLVLYYNAKACKDFVCLDLAPNHLYDGRLTGHKCMTWDIKEVINSIGGIQVLFPLLELASTEYMDLKNSLNDDGFNKEKLTSQDTTADAEWVVVPKSYYLDDKLEKNPVASFLTVLRHMCKGNTDNQERLTRTQEIATIGALMQRLDPTLIDVNVLMAVQLLVECLANSVPNLLQIIYQHVLFDFRIWSKSDFPVRIGHIQYLSTLIKDNRKQLRKKYGVQFMLDVIATYYNSPNHGLSSEDARTIRVSLLGLIKYYVGKGIEIEEMMAIVNFLVQASEDSMIIEVIDMLISLLESHGKDQLYLLLYEQGCADLLYYMIANKDYSEAVKLKVFRLFSVMTRTDKVYDKSKVRLRLIDIGFSGLTMLMGNQPISLSMAIGLVEQVADNFINYSGIMAVMQLIHHTGITIRLQVCRHVLHALYMNLGAAGQLSKQVGWQDTIVRLFAKKRLEESVSKEKRNSDASDGQTAGIDLMSFDERRESETKDFGEEEGEEIYLQRDGVQTPDEISVSSETGLIQSDSDTTSIGPTNLTTPNISPGDNSKSVSKSDSGISIGSSRVEMKGSFHGDVIQDTPEFHNLDDDDHALQELSDMLVEVLFNVMWRGIAGSDDDAWKLVDTLMLLLDALNVWEQTFGEADWLEMAQIGIRILIGFASQNDIELCAASAAKLHILLETRPIASTQEACYLLGSVDKALVRSLRGDKKTYSFLIPLMRAVVDKCTEPLKMKSHLPTLPKTSMSPTFFEDFQVYCLSKEWRDFVEKQVQPIMKQYAMMNFAETTANMSKYWCDCTEALNISTHLRERERGESKLKFQDQIIEPFMKQRKTENSRHNAILNQLRNQHISTLRQWRASKRFLTGERGAWAERNPQAVNWKLSMTENFSRMRPKLTQNYNFDDHLEAAQQRDNIGNNMTSSTEAIPLAVAKEAMVNELEDDVLGDEEWNVVRSESSKELESSKEKTVISEECQLVTIMEVITGKLEVTNSYLYFIDGSPDKEEGGGQDFKWALSQLREVHLRRYNLRRTAIEMFLIDQTNYFINFNSKKVRNKVYGRITGLRPPNLYYYGAKSPALLLKASGLTQKWVNREICNFDYLMQLNTIAGRTYNDLNQYPVFPWVLHDYTGDTLDLDNPDVYRDLSKPIGVVNPKNVEEVSSKYENFEDPSGFIDKFHYGTHYSNGPGVMHYMVRMEPFASLHIQLQSGRFDCADRQFHSIPNTWQSLMDNPNDVKELIPEFFYLPEFLENMNDFDLGKLQTGENVLDVVLPNWANSANDFIYKHRMALESEHVSQHLHEWIDLIFGYKQRGPAAVEALNVFYYCTYEGAVDLDAITDPIERKATEGMINNFGQTPTQLLREPHPRRLSPEEAARKAMKTQTQTLNVFDYLTYLKAFFVEVSSADSDPLVYVQVPKSQARSFIDHGMPDNMITISERGVLGVHGWLPYDKIISNYFTFERDPTLVSPKFRRMIGGPFAPGFKIKPTLFVVSHDSRLLFSGGHWDNSVRVFNLKSHSKGKNVSIVTRHHDIVTCLALDNCGTQLISGSRDTTCMIWEVTFQGGVANGLIDKPLQTLYGHDDEVTSVAISTELDMAASASKDGTCIIHTVRKGHYVRTLRPPCEDLLSLSIPLIAVSEEGHVAVYCEQRTTSGKHSSPKYQDKLSLHLYSINGKHLTSEIPLNHITDMLITKEYLVTGDTQGTLVIRNFFSLQILTNMPLHVPIHTVNMAPKNSHFLVGLRDGKLIIVGIGKPNEIRKLF